MKPTRFVVLRDITPPGWSTPFPRHRTFVDYDARHPVAKKNHQLVYQQRDTYGTVGDMAVDVSHGELLELERNGAIQRVSRAGPREEKPSE